MSIRNAGPRRLRAVDCTSFMSYIDPIANAECLFGSSGASSSADPSAVTVSNMVTSQIGAAQDPCTAGGLLCPQPNSPGAALNPCCHASADSADNTNQPTSTGSVLLWAGGAALLALLLLRK
jgi:hypothetical protein